MGEKNGCIKLYKIFLWPDEMSLETTSVQSEEYKFENERNLVLWR